MNRQKFSNISTSTLIGSGFRNVSGGRCRWALTAGLALLGSASVHGANWFVDDNATGANNGTSWPNAWTSLQSALNSIDVDPGDIVFVGEGTYKPHATSTSVSFVLSDEVEVKGGFRGNNTISQNPDDHDPAVFITTLSGDLSGNDNFVAGDPPTTPHQYNNYSDNSDRVVHAPGTVDPFTDHLKAHLDGTRLRDRRHCQRRVIQHCSGLHERSE